MAEICRLCRNEEAKLSFEHTPPRSAFNNERLTVYGLDDWLNRNEDGTMPGGRVAQRGAGDHTLCVSCNNLTGGWYVGELARGAGAGWNILRELPLDELDQRTEHVWADVGIKQNDKGPHPLRFIKQIVTMLLGTSPPELTLEHPELGDFVLDKERTGLSDRFRIYLALFAGPYARSTGVVQQIDFERKKHSALVEVAFPPFAYVMTIDSDSDPIESVEITDMVDVRYDQRADLAMNLLVAFGHTAVPIDYRTTGMIERDAALSDAEAAT